MIDAAKRLERADHLQFLLQNLKDRLGGMDLDVPGFAQKKKSKHVIEIGIGEKDAFDRRIARRIG